MRIGRFNRNIQHWSLLTLWITSLLGSVVLLVICFTQSERDKQLIQLTAFVLLVAITTTFIMLKRWILARRRKKQWKKLNERYPVNYLPREAYKPKPPLHRFKRTR